MIMQYYRACVKRTSGSQKNEEIFEYAKIWIPCKLVKKLATFTCPPPFTLFSFWNFTNCFQTVARYHCPHCIFHHRPVNAGKRRSIDVTFDGEYLLKQW